MILKRIIMIVWLKGPIFLFLKCLENIKRIYYRRLMRKKRWEKAIKYGEKLVRHYPENEFYYLKLAECYYCINETFKANFIIEKHRKLQFNLNKMMTKIESRIGKGQNMTSRYVMVGGKQNLGIIEHQYVDKNHMQFLTKISLGHGREKEKIFHLKICHYYPMLKSITPRVFNLIELNSVDISLITMDKINGVRPKLNNEMIRKAIHINNIINVIKYKEVSKWFREPSDKECYFNNEKFPENPLVALRGFVTIHKESTNKKVFNAIYQTVQEFNYSIATHSLIKRLEAIIIGEKLYNKINIQEHYSLQQGDFWIHNMILEDKSNKLFILDWGQMRIGPSWIDIAGFFGLLKKPFKIVNDTFITNQHPNNQFTPIEKVFFLYTLIVVWFISFTRDEFENNLHTYIYPAFEAIESMVKRITGVYFEDNIV